ncbi:winged helix-turn-helix domain-containing protein [Streptomyces sp. NPDC001796]|uniref:winged helix-turn-helix domain-containing protein n=1 Tax=Streptomyces sp. NPDC001796 TaxID=3364609 RepID=UPI0036932415
MARIRAVTRRTGTFPALRGAVGTPAVPVPASSEQQLGSLHIDRRTRQVRPSGREIVLTPREFDLLTYLAQDPGAVYSCQQIGPAVAPEGEQGTAGAGYPAWITTARGVGFSLTVPVQ